jgi:transposase
MKRRRRAKRLDDMRQRSLSISDSTQQREAEVARPIDEQAFRCGDRRKLFVGEKPLRSYLLESGQGFVVRLAERIDAMDFRPLLQTYSPIGRHAIHPRIMFGLIVFGTIVGQHSLRDLQNLASCDVRAWWMCRGEQPDHSTIGKFLIAHKEWFASDGFKAAFVQASKGLRLQAHDAAIDGTVIESAASRFNMLMREAAREKAEQAKCTAAASPEDVRAQRAAQDAEALAQVVDQRTAKREKKGKPAEYVKVAVSDPDSVNQPRKDDVFRPSYKVSVIATPEQLIAGQYLDPSSETAAVPDLFAQHASLLGAPPQRVLADAGYHTLGMLAFMVKHDVDILCPAGRSGPRHDLDRKGRFQKHLFVYQPNDTYVCPAGSSLHLIATGIDRDGRRFTKYQASACASCPKRPSCTDAKGGRSVKRFDGEDLKDAQREVMRHPAARAKYRERSWMVEPVFGRLRALGLRRFQRRGLARVRAEFAIACIAYNFKRADAIHEARIAALLVLRAPGEQGHVTLLIAVVFVHGHR